MSGETGLSVDQRIAVMGCVMFAYCLSELVLGASMNSVAMVSDGFHTLADAGSFGVALFASLAGKRWGSGTRIWEALGALVNCGLSLALTLFAGVEAWRRLFVAPHIFEKPSINDSYFLVAVMGIVINAGGALFLGGHGHSHGGLSCPSHADHSKCDGHSKCTGHGHGHSHGNGHEHGHGHLHSHGHRHEAAVDESLDELYQGAAPRPAGDNLGLLHPSGHKEEDAQDLNLQAIWLHTALDAISSLVVLLAGLYTKFSGADQAYKADSIGGILICVLVWLTTVPVFLQACRQLHRSAVSGLKHTIGRGQGQEPMRSGERSSLLPARSESDAMP